jgi:hypothetical protein
LDDTAYFSAQWNAAVDLFDADIFFASHEDVSTIRFKSYIPENEARGTILEYHVASFMRWQQPKVVSDIFRLLILGKYRGIYFDFPVFLFDPAWIANDTGNPISSYCNNFDDSFTKETPMTLAMFFPGSYAYHWHNRWDTPIHRDTIIGHIYDEVDLKFKTRFQ